MAYDPLAGDALRLLSLFPAVSDDPAVDRIFRVLRRSSSILASDRRQLASQLLLRLRSGPEDSELNRLRLGAERATSSGLTCQHPHEGDGSDGLLIVMTGHTGQIEGATCIVDVPGSPRVLSWSHDGTMRWWDAVSGAPLGEPMRHNSRVIGATHIANAPGGTRVLSWSCDYTLRWWDAMTGAPIGEPMRHDDIVGGAMYVTDLPGGPRVLSWSYDGTLRWWDAVTGAPIGDAP